MRYHRSLPDRARRAEEPTPDALEHEIVEALCPGQYISWREETSFVHWLEELRDRILTLADQDAAAVCSLLETFHAGCQAKADEVGGECEFGIFSGSLLTDWVRLQQTVRTDPDQIAADVARWIERDEYGHCSGVGDGLGHVIDDRTAASIGRTLRSGDVPEEARYGTGAEFRTALRTRCTAIGDLDGFLEWTSDTELIGRNVRDLVELCTRTGRATDGLERLDRALSADAGGPSCYARSEAQRQRRLLLAQVERGDEALAEAQREFDETRSPRAFDELLQYAEPAEHPRLRAHALERSASLPLSRAVELLLHLDAQGALRDRVVAARSSQLRAMDEYVASAVADNIAATAPAHAARIHVDLARRILEVKLSQRYDRALRHLAAARDLLTAAARSDRWDTLAADLLDRHGRQYKFRRAFEALLRGVPLPEEVPRHLRSAEADFLDRARTHWRSRD